MSARGPGKPQIRQFPLLAVSGCNQIKGLHRRAPCAARMSRPSLFLRSFSKVPPRVECKLAQTVPHLCGNDPPPPPRALMSRPALGCGAAKRANATSGHQRYRGPGKASGDDIMAVLLLTADYQLWDPREAHTSSTLGNRQKIFRTPCKSYLN